MAVRKSVILTAAGLISWVSLAVAATCGGSDPAPTPTPAPDSPTPAATPTAAPSLTAQATATRAAQSASPAVATATTAAPTPTRAPSPTNPPPTATPTKPPATANPTATEAPAAIECPVDSDTCARAREIVTAWRRSDLDRLVALARPISVACPVPRPTGLGGPYPLCDGATVDGELRTGYLWSSGTHGGLRNETAFRGGLRELLALELKLLSIGCLDSGQRICDGDFVLAFGIAKFGTLEVVYDIPVFVDGQDFGLVGALPRTLYSCSETAQPPCERVLGGRATAPDYRSWGGADTPAPSPDWTFFRWTPF